MAVRMDRRARSEQSDAELVARFQDGDRQAFEALLRRYRGFVRTKSRTYFLVGAAADDVEQEAFIGLFKAARDFRPDRQSSFLSFAELCVKRQMVTAIKAATRRKHQALNEYVPVSLSWEPEDQGERSLEKLPSSHPGSDPAEYVVRREQTDAARQRVAKMLSALEADVLRLYVEDYPYEEISRRLDRQVKAIDNTLQRIKRKLAGQGKRGLIGA